MGNREEEGVLLKPINSNQHHRPLEIKIYCTIQEVFLLEITNYRHCFHRKLKAPLIQARGGITNFLMQMKMNGFLSEIVHHLLTSEGKGD